MRGKLCSDLDIENRTLSITKQVNRINGELAVSPPKTRNSVRTLALPHQAVDLLIAEHRKHPTNPYLFPSPKTGTMYDPDAFRRTHDKILKAIGGVISQQMRRKKQGRYFPYLSPCGPTCESWRNGKN